MLAKALEVSIDIAGQMGIRSLELIPIEMFDEEINQEWCILYIVLHF